MPTWDNKAINGKDLQEQVVTPLASEIKNMQGNVDANTTARHSHSNKSILDGITQNDVEYWGESVHSVTFNGTRNTVNNLGDVDLGYHPNTGGSSATTVQALMQDLRQTVGGRIGSVELTSNSTVDGLTIAGGWYSFIWLPHRTGGTSGDNGSFGTLILTPLTSTPNLYIIEGSGLGGSSPTYRARRFLRSTDAASKLSVAAGGPSQPVYFSSDGIPVDIPLVELPAGSGHNYLTIQAQGAYYSATSGIANRLSNNAAIGSGNQPVYFNADGTPVVIPYDTTYTSYLTLAVLTAREAVSSVTATNVSNSSVYNGYLDISFDGASVEEFSDPTSAKSIQQKLPFTSSSEVNKTVFGMGRIYNLSSPLMRYLRCENYNMIVWFQSRDQRVALIFNNKSTSNHITFVFLSSSGAVRSVEYSDNVTRATVADSATSAETATTAGSAQNLVTVSSGSLMPLDAGSATMGIYVKNGVPTPTHVNHNIVLSSNVGVSGVTSWDSGTTVIDSNFIYVSSDSSIKRTLNIARLVEGKVYQFLMSKGNGGGQVRLCFGNGGTFSVAFDASVYSNINAWYIGDPSRPHDTSFIVTVVRVATNVYILRGY